MTDTKTAGAGHTPGPWRVVGKSIESADSHVTLLVNLFGELRTDDLAAADAALISAAPELLEALEAILAGNYGLKPKHSEPARAAIAKARGQA